MLLFSIPAFSQEYSDDDTLNPFKLAAYAAYPAAFVLENIVVKSLHWLMHLPLMKIFQGIIKFQMKECEVKENWSKLRKIISGYIFFIKPHPPKIDRSYRLSFHNLLQNFF